MRQWPFLILAAFGEIAGCYAFWAWARLGRPVWWLGWGTLSLLMFAWALTRIDNSFAARTFAAYGGVYMAGALAWLVLVEGARPDRWDLLGVCLCLLGTLVILLGPR